MASQPRRPQSSRRGKVQRHRHGPTGVRQRRHELERALAASRLLVERAELGEFRRETRSGRRIAASLARRLAQLTAEAGDDRP